MRSLELFWPCSILAKNLGDVLARSLSFVLYFWKPMLYVFGGFTANEWLSFQIQGTWYTVKSELNSTALILIWSSLLWCSLIFWTLDFLHPQLLKPVDLFHCKINFSNPQILIINFLLSWKFEILGFQCMPLLIM